MVTPNRPADGERLRQFSEYPKSHASRKLRQEIDHSSSQKSSGSKLSEKGLPLSQLGLHLWGNEERRVKCLRKRGHFTKMISKESTSGYISEFIMNRTASSLHLSTSVVWRCRVEGGGSGVVEGDGCRVEGEGSGVMEGDGCRVEGEGSGVEEGGGSRVGQERNILLLFSCPVSGSVYDLGAVSRRHLGSGEPTAWQSHITL